MRVPPSSAPWSASEVCNEGLPPSFFPSSIPCFLFSSFFFHFFLPFFFSFLFPLERADFYQANSIKRIKNYFWISEPDQIPDSLLNSCMNLGKWFTPAPPFFFPPIWGRTVVQLLTWEVVSIHLKNVWKLLHTIPDTKEVIRKHSFPILGWQVLHHKMSWSETGRFSQYFWGAKSPHITVLLGHRYFSHQLDAGRILKSL